MSRRETLSFPCTAPPDDGRRRRLGDVGTCSRRFRSIVSNGGGGVVVAVRYAATLTRLGFGPAGQQAFNPLLVAVMVESENGTVGCEEGVAVLARERARGGCPPPCSSIERSVTLTTRTRWLGVGLRSMAAASMTAKVGSASSKLAWKALPKGEEYRVLRHFIPLDDAQGG